MFKKNSDGTYEFSRRFWVAVCVMALGFGLIAWNTQRVNNRTEQVYAETVAYAQQTNDCLNQFLTAINVRTQATDSLEKLVDQRSSIIDRRFQAWDDFIIGLAGISTDLPQAERDRLAAPMVASYLQTLRKLSAENQLINQERRAALEKRRLNPLPQPNCGNDLPGQ